jgi:serine/threonine protein kinase
VSGLAGRALWVRVVVDKCGWKASRDNLKVGTEVVVFTHRLQMWKVHNNGVSKQQLEAEFNIHAKLKHPNVVRMYSVFKGTRWIYVVLEMVLGGDLFDYLIQKAQHGVEEKVARRWFAQLLDGVDYCRKQNVVHRALKPENILISHPSHDATLKIADFWLSKTLQGNNVCRTNCGTPQYMAPEVHFIGVADEVAKRIRTINKKLKSTIQHREFQKRMLDLCRSLHGDADAQYRFNLLNDLRNDLPADGKKALEKLFENYSKLGGDRGMLSGELNDECCGKKGSQLAASFASMKAQKSALPAAFAFANTWLPCECE